jgi:hypothetical protein
MAIAVLFTYLLISDWRKQASPNRDDAKLRELQQTSAEIPVFPTFRETGTYQGSRDINAGIYKTYRSPTSYEEVKQFYSANLSQRGWVLLSEERPSSWFIDEYDGRVLTFRKGDSVIIVEYAGRSTPAERWNYSVNFVWRDKMHSSR